MSTARVDFTRGAAERIARVVRIVEQGDRNGTPLTYESVDTPVKVFRVCRFTGSWAINAPKTVTFRNTTTTPNTVLAYNLFAIISSTESLSRNCAVAKDGTAWYLIAAEC